MKVIISCRLQWSWRYATLFPNEKRLSTEDAALLLDAARVFTLAKGVRGRCPFPSIRWLFGIIAMP